MRRALPSAFTSLMCAVVLLAANLPAAIALTARGCPALVSGYWHTDGNRVVDAEGNLVRIAAVSWFGMESKQYVPNGLDTRPLDDLMAETRSLGFNAIRLPFSNEMVESNPVVTAHVNANPALSGLHALEILDRIVASAGIQGLRIILDNHRSSAGLDPNESGLWYSGTYPESAWIADWKLLAARYAGNATVTGVDLRNEPHTLPPGPWSLRTYLHQGATWGPFKGKSTIATDWRAAAIRGGNAVLSVNPHLLIIVEGVQQYPDSTQQFGVATSWWGSILNQAARYPVRLAVPHQLVYSTHEYGPLKYKMSWFGPRTTYASLVRVWRKYWADAAAKQNVPIFLGEFGTCGKSSKCIADTTHGSQGQWFGALMRYLAAHPEVGWSFWALNAYDSRHHVMTNYVLRGDWKRIRLPALIRALHGVEATPCT